MKFIPQILSAKRIAYLADLDIRTRALTGTDYFTLNFIQFFPQQEEF